MSARAIDGKELAKAVDRVNDTFVTKDVSEQEGLKATDRSLSSQRNWHAWVGGALSNQKSLLGIGPIGEHSTRGKRWRKRNGAGMTSEPKPITPIPLPRNEREFDASDLGPQYGQDPAFTARMRLHQSWWRANVLKVPCGYGPTETSGARYGNMLDQAAGSAGRNFLTPEIFAVAQRRLAGGGRLERYHLFHNLLSSQPMAFNLFGPLVDQPCVCPNQALQIRMKRNSRREARRLVRQVMVMGLVALAATARAAEPSPPPPKPSGPSPSRSGYLPINGLKVYYEVYGDLGKPKTIPLLLIPGAFMATDSMKPWVAEFAAKRPVIVFDQQGHGRTADTSRKMSYHQFGDDAAGLLRALKVERADVMGYSQGGGVALQLALHHPTLVNKVVSMSATYRRDGWYPAVPKAIGGLNAKAFAGSPIEAAFKKHTSDPKAFAVYVEKMKLLNANDQNITDGQMRGISARTMVIVGDSDGVTLEHAVAMFKLRGGGDEEAATTGTLTKVPAARLVILPATSHIGISGEVKVLEPMVTAFLDDAPPANPSLW